MRHLAALLPLALVAGFALPAYAGTISIEGRGEVTAAPDTAFITSGVTTQGATAREALDLNTKAMAELIARNRGVNSLIISTYTKACSHHLYSLDVHYLHCWSDIRFLVHCLYQFL